MNIAGNYPITQQYFCILGGLFTDKFANDYKCLNISVEESYNSFLDFCVHTVYNVYIQ